MSYQIKIDMTPLETALRKRRITAKVAGKAVMAGLFTLEAHAKLNVRKNFKQHTGDLASRWDTKLDSSSENNAMGHTSPLVVYARIQELGGVIHSTSGGGLVFQTDDGMWHRVNAVTIPARPYLRPAADENKDDIFQSIANILTQVIETGKPPNMNIGAGGVTIT